MYPPNPPHGPQRPVQPHPAQPHGQIVTRTGIGPLAHTIHAVLTLFSCGLWLPVWFLHWLLARSKTVTRY